MRACKLSAPSECAPNACWASKFMVEIIFFESSLRGTEDEEEEEEEEEDEEVGD